jgi:hypothetical protein
MVGFPAGDNLGLLALRASHDDVLQAVTIPASRILRNRRQASSGRASRKTKEPPLLFPEKRLSKSRHPYSPQKFT